MTSISQKLNPNRVPMYKNSLEELRKILLNNYDFSCSDIELKEIGESLVRYFKILSKDDNEK